MANKEFLPTYSIAIRTLGTAGEKFRQELESICAQTVQPERVLVYIAEGYARPDFTVGKEEYLWVKKGIMAQRLLTYSEIESECILMLDDDVLLAPDSAERMLKAMEENKADAVGADVFKNHKMGLGMKTYAAITNLVFPHWSRKWAFKVHRCGSFSYNVNPSKSFYWSQSCAGTAILLRKASYKRFHLEDELWLEALGFPYGADQLVYYKLYSNGGRLGILYDGGFTHLDARCGSGVFQKSQDYIYVRTRALFMNWYRSIYRNGRDTALTRLVSAIAFGFKALWLTFVMCGSSIIKWDGNYLTSYFKGLRNGRKAARTQEFRSIPDYCITEK